MEEEEIETDPTAGVETTQERTIEITIEVIEIGAEIAETTVEIEVEEETDLTQETEEGVNLDQDQVKSILTKVRFVVFVAEVDTLLIIVSDWKVT